MRLTILLPSGILLAREVRKVVAEAPNGAFCLLPRHVDFISAIVPGILAYTTRQGEERFVALDEGILVKQSDTVRVSTRRAVSGEALGRLRERVAEQFRKQDAQEQNAHRAMSKIEAGFVRRFLEIQKLQ
ncbi:MAG: F0F1 ATP synthase subunit epsilon [Desulfobacterales bacterium]|jgi:F-type H+-transporting ATPase subunit epsilon